MYFWACLIIYAEHPIVNLVEMTLEEILEGKKEVNYKGLLPIMKKLIAEDDSNEYEKEKVIEYLDFLRDRARGKYKTGAKLIRDFVMNHDDYKKDSVISPKVNYDLMRFLDKINSNDAHNIGIYRNY